MNYRYFYAVLSFYMLLAQTKCDGMHNVHNEDETASMLAEQYAAYIAGEKNVTRNKLIIDEQDEDRRQNPLKDDPEQQREHSADMCARMDRHVHFIQKAIQEGSGREALDVYEQACRVIIQTLLKELAFGNKGALGQAKKCVDVVAHIALLRNPFWAGVMQKVQANEQANVVIYTAEDLDEQLSQNIPPSHARLLALLEQIQQEKEDLSHVHQDELDRLANQLKLDKQHITKRMMYLLDSLDVATQAGTKMFQPPIAQEAKDLYNQAAINEVKAIVQFKENRDKYVYLEFETAFRAVALTYLKAHDLGHPSALKDAEKLMNGDVMNKIINWKQKHKIEMALASYAAIWTEINYRKRAKK